MEVHSISAMAASIPNSAHAIPEHRLICRVCEKQYSKYTCPQCNVRYCSLQCYKNHSVRCTESLARSNVMEQMSDMKATKESQRQMMEALQRVRMDEDGRSILDDETLGEEGVEDDDTDDDTQGTIFSEKTLKLIADGGDISLDDLTADERKAFLQALATGKISHLIEPWNPWWLNPLAGAVLIAKHGTSLIHPANPSDGLDLKQLQSEASGTMFSEVPAPPSEALAQVRQLIQADPSPLISVQLAEVIYSYCFTLRFCNGDWQSEPLESAVILLTTSQVLDQAASPESIPTALGDAVKSICSPLFKHAGGLQFAISLCDDCSALLSLGRACAVCALADMHRMLESAKRELKRAEVRATKHSKLKTNSGGVTDQNSSSAAKVEHNSVSCEIDKSSSRVGASFADLRKARKSRRGRQGNENPLSSTENSTSETTSKLSHRGDSHGKMKHVVTEIGKADNSSNLSERGGLQEKNCKPETCSDAVRRSKSTNTTKRNPPRGKTKEELRKITTAIRKIYFLMCWTNEQTGEDLSALALRVDAEKERLLEIDVTKNVGLGMVGEVRAPAVRTGPFIEEIVENWGSS